MTQQGQEDSTSGSAASQGGGVVEEAKGAARDVLEEVGGASSAVREKAAGLGSAIKQGLTDQVEQQKNSIADRIGGIAERAQRTADDMSQQEAWLSYLLGRGARELESIAGDIRNNDVASIAGSVEVFARRQPALFVGAAVALGFAATRVMLSSPAASGAHGLAMSDRPYGSRPPRDRFATRMTGSAPGGDPTQYDPTERAEGLRTGSMSHDHQSASAAAIRGSELS